MRDNAGLIVGGLVGRDLDQTWLPVAHRDQRLAPHQPFGAATAYPAPQFAIGSDQRLVARLRRGGRLDPDDGGDDKGFAAPTQLRRPVQHVIRE